MKKENPNKFHLSISVTDKLGLTRRFCFVEGIIGNLKLGKPNLMWLVQILHFSLW